MLKGKKGDISEIPLFVILLFFLAVAFLVVIFTVDQFKGVIDDTDIGTTSTASTYTDALDNISLRAGQRAFVIIFSLLIISMLFSSFLIRIHPIFLFLYIIVLGITLFLGVFVSNTYQQLMNVEALQTIAEQQTMITYIMEHLLMITLGTVALSMLITFGKIFSGGGYTQAQL
jgi:hypothetical protein